MEKSCCQMNIFISIVEIMMFLGTYTGFFACIPMARNVPTRDSQVLDSLRKWILQQDILLHRIKAYFFIKALGVIGYCLTSVSQPHVQKLRKCCIILCLQLQVWQTHYECCRLSESRSNFKTSLHSARVCCMVWFILHKPTLLTAGVKMIKYP